MDVSARTASRLSGALAVLAAVAAAAALLAPRPLADAFFAGWVAIGVGLAVAGAAGAWTNRTPLAGAAALGLIGLCVVGMWSIGFLFAPAALLLAGAAALSQRAGPRPGVRESIRADPPSVSAVALKTLGAAGAVVAGGWLVHAGALTRELFGACAAETLDCALANAHWDAVAVTALGLLAVGVGGWTLWRQVRVARVLASRPT